MTTMRSTLLRKELVLNLIPTEWLFLLLTLLVFVPNYPYHIVFFYQLLSVFFIFLGARTNNDMGFSMLLPVRKRDLVLARVLHIVVAELAMLALGAVMIAIRQALRLGTNVIGLDANSALIGSVLIMYGLFNAIFLIMFYAQADKVAVPMIVATTVSVLYVVAVEASTFLVPVMRHLDTNDPEFFVEKLVFVLVGAVLYVVLNVLAYRVSAARFEKVDL